jgi:hypothetical protein
MSSWPPFLSVIIITVLFSLIAFVHLSSGPTVTSLLFQMPCYWKRNPPSVESAHVLPIRIMTFHVMGVTWDFKLVLNMSRRRQGENPASWTARYDILVTKTVILRHMARCILHRSFALFWSRRHDNDVARAPEICICASYQLPLPHNSGVLKSWPGQLGTWNFIKL